jgi:tetraacyldisaccharide 4'-kinase
MFTPSHLYELIVRSRRALYQCGILASHRLHAPVISVGNLSTGGTGKTPLTAFIAQFLQDAGLATAILSRGYKRQSTGLVEVSDGKNVLCDVNAAGDEPYLLALRCPGVRVVVSQDRWQAGHWLESQTKIEAFILDDAFQHLRLERDLNIALLDATEPPDQMQMLPFGRLREPLSALTRADAVIITRADQAFDRRAFRAIIEKHTRPQTPVFHASHQMTGLREVKASSAFAQLNDSLISFHDFADRPVAAFSGIARPHLFVGDLEQRKMHLVQHQDFRDHHRFTVAEITQVIHQAKAAGATALITTEKDAVRIPAEALRGAGIPVFAAQIEFCCEEIDGLRELILQSVGKK